LEGARMKLFRDRAQQLGDKFNLKELKNQILQKSIELCHHNDVYMNDIHRIERTGSCQKKRPDLLD
jgi:hypothetical protein